MAQRGYVKLREVSLPYERGDWGEIEDVLREAAGGGVTLKDVMERLKVHLGGERRWKVFDPEDCCALADEAEAVKKAAGYVIGTKVDKAKLKILKRGVADSVELTRGEVSAVLGWMFFGLLEVSFLEILSTCDAYTTGLSQYFTTDLNSDEKIVFSRVVGDPTTPRPPPTPLPTMKIVSEGGMEDGVGAMSDFANKNLGGGLLSGCRAQEEILFASAPECVVSMLLFEELAVHETAVFSNIRRYSTYTGYGHTLRYSSPAPPTLPPMEILAYDAAEPSPVISPFSPPSLNRDLVKARTAFSSTSQQHISTGNWGCGAFFGCRQLKSTLLWLAAACSNEGKTLHYHTFGDKSFTKSLCEFAEKLLAAGVTAEALHDSLMRVELKRNRAHELILADLGLN